MERRLIDPKEAYNLACEGGYYSAFAASLADLASLGELLEDCTTIDAVEVVRCRECEHWKKYADHSPFIGTCKIAGYFVGENGYCVYGKRREPDENNLHG